MTEVKSLNVTAETYRHRGWMWRDRATYESFKRYMKLPLWVDRILMNANDSQRFVVGSKDGERNAVFIGNTNRAKWSIPAVAPSNMPFNCNTGPRNEFVVLAERIRAKKPDANKAARPQWRRRIAKPWEPGVLGGNWVVDSKFVVEVKFKMPPPPAWADRLWVSTSANTDTFVWVDSKVKEHAYGGELHTAKHAEGIKGHQISGGFEPDSVVCNSGSHWQLAGVRKKTVWVPEPEVIKPVPDVQGTATSRVTSLNPLLSAPYGTDVYSKIAQELGVSRSAAKVRLFRDMYTPQSRGKTTIFDYANLERMMMAYCVQDVRGTPKPPIGVKPRNLHDEERANALDEAMVRYLNEDLPFPIEWATEWNELRARLNKEQK